MYFIKYEADFCFLYSNHTLLSDQHTRLSEKHTLLSDWHTLLSDYHTENQTTRSTQKIRLTHRIKKKTFVCYSDFSVYQPDKSVCQ